MEPRTSDILGLEAAAKQAGISTRTLQHYIDYGFIRTEQLGDEIGIRLDELQMLFGERSTMNGATHARDESTQDAFEESADTGRVRGSVANERLAEQVERVAVSTAETAATSDRLQEMLLEEIGRLREERDWLRERLERLEVRSERDQMLMLSELETIRSLAAGDRGRPRRSWRSLLPWGGGQS